jgi:Sortase and related acyltransferases
MDNIRIAEIADLERITEIYNQAVSSKFETADTVVFDSKDRLDWFYSHPQETYPIFVYELNGAVVGWISISPYRCGRKALRFTAEISYYVHSGFKRKGIGSKLVEFTLNKGKTLNFKTLFAIILDKNIASINLLKKFGFTEWGHLPDVADFDGVECGHVYYGRKI